MARKWKEIRGEFTPAEEAAIREKKAQAERALTLHQLRKARNLTQATLAKTLKINQCSVSALEKRTDVYLSTMRSYVEAMGGELRITAVFPDGEIAINQFEDVA